MWYNGAMDIKLEFKLEDAWVGVFWKHSCRMNEFCGRKIIKKTDVWICLVPCLPLHITWEVIDRDFEKRPCNL
jgi:hypothetical protein